MSNPPKLSDSLELAPDGGSGDNEQKRCRWCLATPLYIAYHDSEWGVPEHDDLALFAKLLLDGFQVGLSWLTILRKRAAFYRAFDDFDAARIARYDARKLASLQTDGTIVRHRGKIAAAVSNAQAYLELRAAEGSFNDFLWQFVGGVPQQNHWRRQEDIPAQTDSSRAMSRALGAYGFKFCGPTICYAFMQAVGMVNDHLISCFRHAALSGQHEPAPPLSQPPLPKGSLSVHRP